MAFQSSIGGKEIVIDDTNFQRYTAVVPPGMSKGREARDWQKMPFGSPPFKASASPMPAKIPRGEWAAKSAALEQSGQLWSQRRKRAGLKSLDQNGTNYCWCNAVVSALRLLRLFQNEPVIDLSPASVAAPIKGYRNQGGWGGEALDYIIKNGIAPQSDWPANAISKQYDNATSQASRQKYKVTEWWELQSGDFDMLYTLLLLGVPVAIGLDWWSHEVCAVDPLWVDGKPAVRIWNSWNDSWSESGMGTLTEQKATPDDAVAPAVATAA